MIPERPRPSDHVFPQPALRLVHAERRATLERRTLVLVADALLVKSVSGFMHRSEEQRQRLPVYPTSGDSHVAGADAGGKRMKRLVLPASAPVEAERGHHVHSEPPDVALRICGAEKRGSRRWPRRDVLDDGHLTLPERVEEFLHFRGLHPWLVVVEQHIVGMIRGRKKRDIPAFEIDDLLEMRREQGEVRRRAGLGPRMLRR